ncbi:hypothetical protein [Streptomyces abikoensis]|uniref:Uncharacterized protein n=1 Tax=Streptomyces abikoensis TaxID=97398 RepID=A0ABW7SW29_9ACTN
MSGRGWLGQGKTSPGTTGTRGATTGGVAGKGSRPRGKATAMTAAALGRARRAGAGAARAGFREAARARRVAGPLVRKAFAASRAGLRRAAATPGGRLARALWHKARARARDRAVRMARGAGAALAAGLGGVLALVPGLLLGIAAMATGGVLRWARQVPRGALWGIRYLRWGPIAAARIWAWLMTRAPQVATDFPGPGHSVAAPAALGSGSHFGGHHVSQFVLHTEGARDAYAKYDPPSMLSVQAEYKGLPDGIGSVAQAICQLAINCADKYPVDKAIAEVVARVQILVLHAEAKASEVYDTFVKEHEHDLMRFEAPRNNEHMWNIASRRPDGSLHMRHSVFSQACEEVQHIYTRYEPESMTHVAAEFEGLPTGLENIAAAVNFLAVKSADEYPVEKTVAETVAEVHQTLLRAASAAQELFPLFRRLHALDIRRHEDPRNGEEKWDV